MCSDDAPNMVPKVHPATRPVEPDDPMTLHGAEVEGDPELMLAMVVEEFARLGFGEEELLQMFRNPFYRAAHGLWLHFGDDGACQRVRATLRRCGVIRATTVVSSGAPPQPSLVQVALPGHS